MATVVAKSRYRRGIRSRMWCMACSIPLHRQNRVLTEMR
jgi:hypothetical protein